ncbi:MAG: hypothetical protein QXR57_06070 [Metallosphaera sp.]|uniref:hypothetical protein n=1 Tax=Metallosphaera sp. TaxID=2020860 RepID=UPI0031642EFD
MRVKSVNVERNKIEFCYNQVSVTIQLLDNELRIAEEVTYEVATGQVFSIMQIVLKQRKVFLISPFGENVISDPENIIDGLKDIVEMIKWRHKSLYLKFVNFLSDY